MCKTTGQFCIDQGITTFLRAYPGLFFQLNQPASFVNVAQTVMVITHFLICFTARTPGWLINKVNLRCDYDNLRLYLYHSDYINSSEVESVFSIIVMGN